jgi:hypothetical protein
MGVCRFSEVEAGMRSSQPCTIIAFGVQGCTAVSDSEACRNYAWSLQEHRWTRLMHKDADVNDGLSRILLVPLALDKNAGRCQWFLLSVEEEIHS